MFKNYLKVAFRYLANHKGYTFINTLGLSVGIASCILIMLFVKSEWSFDRFHPKSARLYRAWVQEHTAGQVFTNTVTPIPLGPVLQAGLPEVESSCRLSGGNTAVKYNNHLFSDPVAIVDSTFFDLFNFPLREGDSKNPFPSASSMIISERMAKKYFGNETPIGKNLEVDLNDSMVLFSVSGVARNPPLESSIQFDMLIPFSNAHYIWSEKTRTRAWSNVAVETYFLLKKGVKADKVNATIPSIMDPLVAASYKPGEYIITLQPMTDIHLNNHLPAGQQPISDPKYSYILATVGLFILLIACINFITLSIGRSTTRAMEVGVRKVLGAERKQLIGQFWGEALLLTLVALIIGTGIAAVLAKPFGLLANRQLSFSPDLFTILFCFILAAIIALLAGIYPAIVLSGFKPIQALKNRMQSGHGMGFFRKALVTGQFAVSIIMIIAAFSVGSQLNYLRTKDLGYNREHVVIVPTNKSRKEGNKFAALFKATLQKNPEISGSSTSLYTMAEAGWMNMGYSDDKNVFRQFVFNAVDPDFVTTMGLQVVAGRNFSKDNTADSGYILVNEALVKEYGWTNPVGQRLPGRYEEQVIGVVKDFNFESLHTGIKPVVMALRPDSFFRRSSDISYDIPPEPRVSIHFSGGSPQQHIEFLRSAWKSVSGNEEFEFQFLDNALEKAYQQEQRLGMVVRYGSFLAIFIACMGLFGLVTLIVVRRTKEIGIRKVLGANVSSIVSLLSKQFVILVLVASLLAFPVAWWGMNKWLQDFAYRISIGWWVFAIAAIITLIIALLTVSFQAIKAAVANPVESLRTE
ncbi:MAG TPA: ABC transporter permease [Chitinophagaceae bacterium]|jgi:putative ABC transport system permease protein|nr:ABC transporter permease [Chitinophagaceae bacterium]